MAAAAPARARPRPARPARPPAPRSRTSSAASRPARPASGPRHATPARQQQAQRQQQRAANRQATAQQVSTGTGKAVSAGGDLLEISRGKGGQHALAAELLLFLGIVGIRAVAQYGPGDKSKLPSDQYGPLFILGNGLAAFFVLSFFAARGGMSARLAAAAGLILDVALLMKSAAHLEQLATEYAAPRHYVPEALTGSYSTGEAPVLSPALAYELNTGKLPPQPKGASTAKYMAYAKKSLSHYGLSPGQWGDLVKLWTAESGWRANATNPSSGAYGIAQALPPTKYPKAAQQAGGSNGYDQIDWGLAYIKQRYGSLANAWAHEQHYGWY